MTSYDVVFEAFLSSMLEDEWTFWTDEEQDQDMKTLLENGIVWFVYSRTDLERNESGFINTLTNMEVQIIATYMRVSWLERNIYTWENVKPQYAEKDFSQANLLDKMRLWLVEAKKDADKKRRLYSRAPEGKVFPFEQLAGSSD